MAIGNGSFPKDTREGGFPYGDDQGMAFVVGAGKAGTSLAFIRLVSGGTPDTVVFADLGLPDMADDQYVVLAQAEAGGAEQGCCVDESTKTPQSFDVLNGAAAEVLNVMVAGTIAGQSA